MKLIERPMGEVLDKRERESLYEVVVAGVSWPARRPGYAVVLGYGKNTVYEPLRTFVLDEYADWDIMELVKQCCVLDFKWNPARWFGDTSDDAARQIRREIVQKYQEANESYEGLCIASSRMMDMQPEALYRYLLPQLKKQLKEDAQTLFLKDSLVKDDLLSIDHADLPDLKLGDYPSIEALAFAAQEVERAYEDKHYRPKRRSYPRSPMQF